MNRHSSSSQLAPVRDRDIRAIEQLARDLSVFASDLSSARTDRQTTQLQLRALVQRYFDEISEVPAPPAENAASSCGDSRIDRALDYIRTHRRRPSLALSDVSDFVRMSRWHLSRLFTRHVGMGFREVVRALRMEEATALLDGHLLSIKEIAAQLGFAHPTEFDRQFKQTFNVTPTEWRQRHARAAAQGGS